MPSWLPPLAETYILLSLLSAVLVAADILVLGHRQKMAVMDVVWPLTILYWRPLGLPFYAAFGRATAAAMAAAHAGGHGAHGHDGHGHGHHHDGKPNWQSVFTGATHCGAGCVLGDLLGDWLVFATGMVLFGSALGAKYVLAFVLAFLFGIAFQYASIVPMRGLGWREGIVAAVKVDTLSILAYEVGMFLVMGLRAWLLPDLAPTTWTYWFFMQVAMLAGFWTTYPVNWWLIARGTKEAM
ncbi:MAG: DUF4396 domain-containing protein [Rhodospirillales bacterium]|nr:DUF4396 domain-containing protein [Rhodospirillales bacterium]